MSIKEKIKEAILTTLVVSNKESFDNYTWPKIEKIINESWISVEKELPDYDELVIWYREDGIMFIDEIDHDSDWEYFESIHCSDFPDNNDNIQITHWRKLPDTPNQGGNDERSVATEAK